MKNQSHLSQVSTFFVTLKSFGRMDMKKIVVILFCSLFSFPGNVQANELSILKENLKRGIYLTYEQFVNNNPIVTDSFYVDTKERKRKNWKGTNSLIPRYAKTGQRITNVWGFCDGTAVFVYHQKDFSPIEMKGNHLDFFGFANKEGSSKLGNGIMKIGGGITKLSPLSYVAVIIGVPIIVAGGIVAISTSSSYKKQKIEYSIDPETGKIY